MKIAEAIRDAELTPIQAVHLLATMVADEAARGAAREETTEP